MDYEFTKDFLQLCRDVAELKASVATLATQSDDRAAMKAAAADLATHGTGLQQAVDGAKAAEGV